MDRPSKGMANLHLCRLIYISSFCCAYIQPNRFSTLKYFFKQITISTHRYFKLSLVECMLITPEIIPPLQPRPSDRFVWIFFPQKWIKTFPYRIFVAILKKNAMSSLMTVTRNGHFCTSLKRSRNKSRL